jgi:hypothetical protein
MSILAIVFLIAVDALRLCVPIGKNTLFLFKVAVSALSSKLKIAEREGVNYSYPYLKRSCNTYTSCLCNA